MNEKLQITLELIDEFNTAYRWIVPGEKMDDVITTLETILGDPDTVVKKQLTIR